MPTIQNHTPGTFCWWELATPDVEAAWRFYHGLFRWEKRDQPIGEGQVYRICVLEGQDVCAMYRLDPAQQERGVASAWLPYIAVEDAEETATRVTTAGGAVLTPPFDVFESGRMAALSDTEGARLAIWQPNQHRGAGIIRDVGTVCWTELAARDAGRARRFYATAFGWKPEAKAMGAAGDYTYWHVAGEPTAFGGMLAITADWGDLPPAWMTYFKVADCDDFTAAVARGGGRVLMGPWDAADVGRIALVQDPTGGRFSGITFVNARA